MEFGVLLITGSIGSAPLQARRVSAYPRGLSQDLRFCAHPPACGSDVIQGSIAVAGMKVHGAHRVEHNATSHAKSIASSHLELHLPQPLDNNSSIAGGDPGNSQTTRSA
jgi:hypothetical protein